MKMKKRAAALAFGLALAGAAGCGAEGEGEQKAEVTPEPTRLSYEQLEQETYQKLNGRIRELSMDAVQNMGTDTDVFSPFSAYLSFACLANGMNGEEREALNDLLVPEGVLPEELNSFCADAIDTLSKKEKTRMNTELLAVFDDAYEVDAEFQRALEGYYWGSSRAADFENPDTTGELNDWISEQTQGMIPKFFEQPLDKKTELVLLNTVYFQGKWQTELDEEETREMTFHGANGDTEAEMMRTLSAGYAVNRTYQAISVDYIGAEASFQIYLPKEGHTLFETAEQLRAGLPEFETRVGDIQFPKFTTESKWDLLKLLEESGYGDMKNLSVSEALTDGEENRTQYLKEALQKARIRVDEEGTEAAAVNNI